MSHNITSTFTEDSYWFGSKQSYQRNSYRGQNQVQRNSYNQNRSKAKSFVSDNKSPNDDSPLPDVTYKLKFEDLDIDPINVILDSGADTNLIATDLAKELGLMVFPYPQKFLGLGGEGDSTIANGFTKMFIKLLPNHNCMSLKIYVFDNLPHKLILGTNFLYQAEINFQFNKDKSCRVLRHGKPLIASAIVPGIRVWGVWFDVYFDENFGANTFWSVYKEKMKEIFLNQRNKDKDEDASGDTSNESAVWNRIVEQHLTDLNY